MNTKTVVFFPQHCQQKLFRASHAVFPKSKNQLNAVIPSNQSQYHCGMHLESLAGSNTEDYGCKTH
jgi:hypothetical protein